MRNAAHRIVQQVSRKGLPALMLAASALSVSAQDAAEDGIIQQQTQFAPGVVTVIPGDASPSETFDGPLALQRFIQSHPELEWDPTKFENGRPHFDPRSRTLIEMAKQVVLRREIYCLEFAFKPLRQIYVDVPLAGGQTQRKLIWYMVYRVRYTGKDLRPAADEIGGAKMYSRIENVSYESRRFFPLATLKDQVSGREYLDRLIPSAKPVIAARERITAPLYNSVEVFNQRIPLTQDEDSPGVWGVLTWMDVAPDIDFLSLYVSGLTNAFEQDGEGKDAPYRRKMLQLNFFRPGDAMNQTADSIRFGMPPYSNEQEHAYILDKYNVEELRNYRWVFRSVK
ncbi:hypothetical protein LOC67_01030 [Stieleria sp. JC731]|nr:hypothetical protein [Stieleria sp. JC731]MCC9599124.1 hypothetical protein [Stieleria sp. JC731]